MGKGTQSMNRIEAMRLRRRRRRAKRGKKTMIYIVEKRKNKEHKFVTREGNNKEHKLRISTSLCMSRGNLNIS